MKLNYKRTFLIGFAFLSISSFWQMYDSIIPLILQNSFHMNETLIGVIMAMDNVLAVFLLPLFGVLSDKCHSKLGKRTPFIIGGTIVAVIFMMLLPVADHNNSLVLFVAALGVTLLAMAFYRSPAVALMPDLTPKPLRSKANAVINLMGAVGGIYSLLMITLLVGKEDRPNYTPLFLSVAALMALAVILLVSTIRENKIAAQILKEFPEQYDAESGDEEKSEVKSAGGAKAAKSTATGKSAETGKSKDAGKTTSGAAKKDGLAPDVKKSLIFLLVSIFLWFTAYNAVTTAFSRYARTVWNIQGGGFANCLMVATVAAIISYIPIGFISSRIGRKKTICGGIILMTACYLAAFFFTTFHPAINIGFACIGIGWAAISVNSLPMVVEMCKGSDVGKYTGFYYTFSMAAQIFTPIFSGFLLGNVSYRILFPYAVVFSALAFVTMCFVHHGDSKPPKKSDVLENFDIDD